MSSDTKLINGYDVEERVEILDEALRDLASAGDALNCAGSTLDGEVDWMITHVKRERAELLGSTASPPWAK